MTGPNNSFSERSQLAHQVPEQLVDHFWSQYNSLTAEAQRALIAATPGHDTLMENIKSVCSSEDTPPLAGVPYVLQDLFDVNGLPTRCGAPFQEPFEAPLEEDSLLYQQLNKLGAVLLAKTVPSEFGADPQGRNRSFGDCTHAEGSRYICGGGAGASAHLVKAGWAPLAFGLDGSAGVRIPAAFHGLFAFRMGNNAYAREGTFPIVPSLESVGFFTRYPEDLQRTIEAFYPIPKNSDEGSARGFLLDDASSPLDPILKAGLMSLVRHLDIDDCPKTNKSLCKAFRESNEAFATIEGRELYAIHKYWIEEYRSRYEESLLRRIEAGQICTAKKADHASSIQQLVRESMVDFFHKYDYLIVPISPVPTPDKVDWNGQLENDLLRLNAPTSLTFLPALILPFPCNKGRYSAIQLILNPRKTHLTKTILKQVSLFYGE